MLSDVDHAVGVIYETQRHPDERTPEWAKRRTYLIDPEGMIRKAYRVRDTEAHPGEVLEDLRQFQSNG
jgi:peroxiredoxin